MINYLKDIKKSTLIGLLPDVINSNNESIRNEFNWIYDSSLNRLTKSVYAPTGSVKAHFGEFVNLACEYFTVKNVDSLKASILDSVESIIRNSFDPSTKEITNHNLLNNRFVNSEFEDDDQQDFCHDAAAIVYKKENDEYVSVEDALNIIEDHVEESEEYIRNISDNIAELDASVKSLNINVNDLSNTVGTYDNSINELKTTAENIKEYIDNLDASIIELNGSIESDEQTLETANSSVNTLETSVNIIETDIQELNSAINELSNDVESVEQTIETINSSIRKINNSIDNLSNAITDLEDRNSNNIILNDPYVEIIITKNQYNFIATPISDNEAIIEIKFDDINLDDINHEYNFKFILDSGVETVYIHNDEWYNPGDNATLYINYDNNTYYISYSENDNLIIISRNNINNSAMCDITLNRYINDNIGIAICILLCKVYELHVPLEITE